jgi:hypothetical protein
MCFTSLDSLGDIITKDGVKIQFYMKKSKKPIPIKYNGTISGITGTDNLLEKIVLISPKKLDINLNLEIKIYNTSISDILLYKSIQGFNFSEKNRTYTLPVYPWVDDIGYYTIVIREIGVGTVSIIGYDVIYPDGEG